ncbi:sensor histidine kinase [Dictyobacter alpinus]|uniref:histidine kinase n=1 Tax=Dictyobacter alpinus TaxID=2014873 RepID=A0A402BJN4_9CHLR|nr:PAS domain S-box protein [Dictyobacter alpinus]GCE31558.1 sensor histidine kinase [Dictyobacter alpinus]
MAKLPDPAPQEETSTISELRSAVRQTEHRFEVTFEQAAVGMAHVALDGRWLYVNQRLCDITGYQRDELIGMTFQEMTFSEDLAANLAYIKQLVAGEISTYSMDKRYIHKDGHLVWAHLTAALSRDEDGTPQYFISVIEDIHERKKLEEDLYHQRQAFMAVVENAPDIITRYDRAGRFLYINPAGCKVAGRAQEEIVGKTHAENGFPEQHNRRWQHAIAEVFRTQKPLELDLDFTGPTGRRFYQANLAPEFDARGRMISILSVTRDITDRKLIEEERVHLLAAEKQAHAEAEAERQRLYDLFMQVPALVCLLKGPEHVFEFANSRYMQIVGNRELIGKTIREALPEVADQGIYELLDQVYATGKAFHGNEVLVMIDRKLNGHLEEGFFNFVYQPARDTNGEINGIMVHAVEVTEQIRNRNHLRSSQQRLQLAQQAAHIGTFEWMIAKNEIIWTPELEALYGLPAGGFEGRYENWAQRVHPADLARAEESLQGSINGGPPYNVEFRVVWPDGSQHWMLGKGEVAKDENGRAERVFGVNIDITERKEAELQLAKTLEQVGFIASSSKLLVASMDYQEVLVHVIKNAIPAIADWCRIDLHSTEAGIQPLRISYPDTLLKTQELNFKLEDPATVTIPAVIASIREEKTPALYTHLNDKDLQELTYDPTEQSLLRALHAESAIVMPLTVQGQIEGTITFVASRERGSYTMGDLNIVEELASRVATAIERARIYHNLQDLNANLEERVAQRTDELRMLNANLERSNQELQEFAYVASHDLQEPLRKIQAFGNLLEEEYGAEISDGKEYLDRMRNAAARMRVLIDDLLTFSRVATKTLPFSPISLDLVARDVIEDLETRIQETQGTIELGELPTIEADSRQLYQVLQNLLGNALKFHRPNVPPVIKVSATIEENSQLDEFYSGPNCILTVQDNGIGFDEKYLDRIFTVFQRLHGRTEYEGTGIGLAVVRKIVERHGGTITATSTIGEGSTFIVTLPVTH